MNEKQIFQALVVMVLLASVALTAALAEDRSQSGWDRLDPQENDGRNDGQTYGDPYRFYTGDHWTDGPGNFTDENWNGIPLEIYFTLWSLDRDTETDDQPNFSNQYSDSRNWIRDNTEYNESEATRTRDTYLIANHSDVAYSNPPHDVVQTYNRNDFKDAPTNKFEYKNTTYIPEGIRQIGSTSEYTIEGQVIEVGRGKSENHAAGGPKQSVQDIYSRGACRTFKDKSEEIPNGSHERVTDYRGEDSEKYDTHCWIESAYVDEHSVEGLVIVHEAYTGIPSKVNKTIAYPGHPLNETPPQQEDNKDGIRRFVPDNGTARAVADFRANTTDTYSESSSEPDADDFYPSRAKEAEFEDEDEKTKKVYWNQRAGPYISGEHLGPKSEDAHVNWTRLVNVIGGCPTPYEYGYSDPPPCQLAIVDESEGDKNTYNPILNYSLRPGGGDTVTGDYRVGKERRFHYQTKFSSGIYRHEVECMRVDDDPSDREETKYYGYTEDFQCTNLYADAPGPDEEDIPVHTWEEKSLDYIAEDETYVHAQNLDAKDTPDEDAIKEFDAALYENGDRAIHFETKNEPWRRVGLHGSEFGLSGGFSYYTTRNQQYDQFTRYAYPTKYTTYSRNVTGYYREENPDATIGPGQIAYPEDKTDFSDDLRQNSSVTPISMHSFPTAAGIRVSPDSQSEVTNKIVLTEVGSDDTVPEPPTAILPYSKGQYVYIDRELPENKDEYSRGTEIALRYNRGEIKEEMQVDTPYGYADEEFTSPSYDEHNITITGMTTNETRKLNVSSELSDDRSKDTINETTLMSEVVNQNREENTVTVEFKLTTSNGPVNMEKYEDECSEDDGIGKIVVPRKDMSNDEFQTRHDNGTVRYTFNKSNISGDALTAQYEPVDWWDVPEDCYPMHEPSSTSTIIKSTPLFTGVIRQVIGFILALAILSYAFNTVVVAAGGERPEESFFSWLVSEVYDAIRGWLR